MHATSVVKHGSCVVMLTGEFRQLKAPKCLFQATVTMLESRIVLGEITRKEARQLRTSNLALPASTPFPRARFRIGAHLHGVVRQVRQGRQACLQAQGGPAKDQGGHTARQPVRELMCARAVHRPDCCGDLWRGEYDLGAMSRARAQVARE